MPESKSPSSGRPLMLGTRPAGHCEGCDSLETLTRLRDGLCAGCRDDALSAERFRLGLAWQDYAASLEALLTGAPHTPRPRPEPMR